MAEQAPVATVIPAYQAGRYLREALESVLAQTAVPRQIIVVDDGSTDDTAQIARSFSAVTLVAGDHAGISAAMNRGIAAATEEYVALLDADDLWAPIKIERQLQVARAEDPPDIVFGAIQQFFSPDASDELRRRVECPSEPQRAPLVGTFFARRSVFETVGLFSTELRVGGFVDWCARAEDLGLRRFVIEDVLLRRRIHGANVGLSKPEARSDFVRIAKAALDRRRQRS